MKASEIMTRNLAVVTPDDPISKAAQIMRDHNVGMLPVVDDTTSCTLKGVLTDRDIVVRCVARKHGPTCTVRDHMTSGRVDAVRPNDDVRDVVARMEHDQVRRMPVVSDGFRLTGVIAQADVARKVGQREPILVTELLEKVSAPSFTNGRLTS